MSKRATPVVFVGLFSLKRSSRGRSSLFVSSFANVDLPEDLGPQIMIIGGLVSMMLVEHLARIAFHSGAEMIGCT